MYIYMKYMYVYIRICIYIYIYIYIYYQNSPRSDYLILGVEIDRPGQEMFLALSADY